MTVDPAKSRTTPRSSPIDALHVFVLCGFGFAQPLYALLGQQAEFFVARGTKPLDLAAFVLVLSIVIPSILVCGLTLIRLLSYGVYRAIYPGVLSILAATISLPFLKRLPDLPNAATLGLATLLGIGFGTAYHTLRSHRWILTMLAPAVFIFPVVFLFLSPASKIAFPDDLATDDSIATATSHSPIVFLLFDLFPVTALMDEQQNIDAKRYPNFGRLAQQAHWFRQATTVSTATAYAVPALLSGRYPKRGALPITEDYPRNLFTLFGPARTLNVFESGTRLCPRDLCDEPEVEAPAQYRWIALLQDTYIVYLHVVLPESWTERLPQIDAQWHNFTMPLHEAPGNESRKEEKPDPKKELKQNLQRSSREDRIEKYRLFLSRLQQRTDSLSYMHLYLPHGPFLYLPSGRRYVPEGKEYRKLKLHVPLGKIKKKGYDTMWRDDEYLVNLAYQRLLFQISLADKLLGQLLDRLQEIKAFDNSLIIVAADHGQSYNPGKPLRSMTDADTAHVPLFIKLPGQTAGAIDDRNAEIIDVLPTIIDALNLDVPWEFDGRSLLEPSPTERPVKRMVSPKHGVEDRDWPNDHLMRSLQRKLVRAGSGESTRELFAIGPFSELLGQQVSELSKAKNPGIEVDASTTLRVWLDQAQLLRDVAPDSDFVPAYLTGQVEAQGMVAALDLAISINGIIQATCRTYQGVNGQISFAAMIPERAFSPGRNSWAVYAIDTDGAGRMRLLLAGGSRS